MSTIALIVAGGSSERFGGAVPKQFRALARRPLLSWTIQRFEDASLIDEIVVVVAEEYLLHTNEKVVNPFGFAKVSKIVIGGANRMESVKRGLEALPLSTDFVAIHDGARPLVDPKDIDRVVALARKDRAAMLALPVPDTVKRVADGFVLATLDRSKLYLAQTPQVFQYDLISEAHDQADDSAEFTDDSSLIESRGFKVRICEPEYPNFKITTYDDLKLAQALISGSD